MKGLALVALLLIPAALEARTIAGSAAALTILGGDNQTAFHGTRLPDLLLVRATDLSGNPAAGVAVRFEATSGGGSIAPSIVYTDADGRAAATATLSDTLGPQQFQAIVDGISGSPATFQAIAKNIALETVVSGLFQPVFLGNAHDGSNRRFIVEQDGHIRVLEPGAPQSTVFLDISSRVLCCGEQGLLGLAFHPQFAANRRFFVNYTRTGDGATIVAEYHASATNPNVADPDETVILTIAQPYANHNGGMLAFGPDGFLYIGMGDGGAGGDPDNRAQNINDLLGKMLRINVSQIPYSSPNTNPFFGATPGRDEIYALGLRNPWRFSFDRLTGQLYVGDVGQDAREEIDILSLGGNYGWRVREGTLCTNLGPASCATPGFIEPIADYAHTSGRCAVTGGYVYRGTRKTLQQGAYLFGDFCTGELFFFNDGVQKKILDTGFFISSFGEDEDGELYVVDLRGGVSRVVAVPETPALSGINPSIGFLGESVSTTLTGTGFASGLFIDAGSGISASNISVTGATSATAILNIGPAAALGNHGVTVATAGGTSDVAIFTVLAPVPTLTTVSPATGVQGASAGVTLTGTNLFSSAVAVSGTGVSVSNVVSGGGNSVTATFTISPTASAGPHDVTITTPGGTTAAVTFTVTPMIPVLTRVAPTAGVRGMSVNVALTGSGFVNAATTIGAMAGITIQNVIVESPTAMTAVFVIAPGATLGARSVTVTTAGGTSGSAVFSVVDAFPDLAITLAHAGNFGVGFDENYSVAVRNVGLLPAGPMIVTDALPAGFTFVAGTGPGWLCSAVSQLVTCISATILAPNDSSAFSLKVAVGAAAVGNIANAVAVTTAGDLNSANDQASDVTTVLATPTPGFVFTPSTLAAGKQATVTLTLPVPFPHDVSGALILTFTPDPSVAIDDPAIQFASGGRVVTFTIPANASEAGPIGFQTGTVAGVLTFGGTLQAGLFQKSFSSSAGANGLTISRQPPAILSVRTSAIDNGFAALIALFSTSREVTQLTVTFNSTILIRLSCGSVPGCSASGSTITFNVASLFAAWFQSDATFGSLSTLRLPFSIQGTIVGSVSVTLSNSQGVSNALTFALP